MTGARFAATAGLEDSCLFLDLETLEDGRLCAIGAVLGGREFLRPEQGRSLRDPAGALAELDGFARDARWVAGHNLIGHDVPHLRIEAPDLGVLRLPAIDTLVLSPLAFPRRPYHQLVKDYKLVGDAKSNPAGDARLARQLLADETDALTKLGALSPERLDVMRSCLAGWAPAGGGGPSAAGTAAFFGLVGARAMDDSALVECVMRLLGDRVCRATAREAIERTLADAAQRPAVAYALEWVLVADTRSVLPRWVARAFPAVVRLLRDLRETPCGSDACAWCAEVHSPRRALTRWFGFPGFRGPPCGEHALPMQEEVVRLGMAGRSSLAILPTSFGKSLCYQLPAIVRYQRRGALTVVISPLQALMKDQVDVLERRVNGQYAAAIHGMLTPPERGDVLARIRDGSLTMVYASPEQVRNRSVRSAIRAREIGAWVFDEAHCVSKWGHDFRTDYRYAARFIRDFSAEEGVEVAPVACFTATAKREVKEDVVAHFRDELGVDLFVVEAPVDRPNLSFSVREVTEAGKLAALDAELHAVLDESPGSAIVYLATRRRTEEAARFLAEGGWTGRVEAFHAGVEAPRKREIQEAFQRGDLRVICATNAFGMGIDKPDVRLVVHADVPGSLENYLQEAGRAGRDEQPSSCVLLWCPADLDVQFGLLARSRLTQRDIGQVLRAVRRARHGGAEEVVVTPRELLQDERTEVSFDAEDRDAKTKVQTAVAWLERAEFLRRDENHTRVFQGRPKVRDLDEARARIDGLGLSEKQRERWMRILHALLTADDRQGLDLDELAAATGLQSWTDEAGGARPAGRRSPALLLLNTLRDMARQGLIDEGLSLSAFVRAGIADSSEDRRAALDAIETALLDVLREAAPDLAPGNEAVPLDLRSVNEALCRRGHATSPETVRGVLHSLAEDGRGLAGGEGSLAISHAGGDRYRIRLQRTWDALATTSSLRRKVAERSLEAVMAKAARDGLGKGTVLVAFSMDDLVRHLDRFGDLTAQLREPVAAVERALLSLHERKALILQKGLSVFRQAMGIRFHAEARSGPYTAGDYSDLRIHYQERVHHAHAMGEYARLGVTSPRKAQEIVADYFGLPWAEFARRWFAGKDEEIARATSREAYRRIVEDLRNAPQQRIVAAHTHRNLLVLAGPGSGKTRVVVHRCAYLLLVERVPPTSILVLCFNRAACHELRTRLRALAGPAAAGVQVHTYHGLALRLTGRSLARGSRERPGEDAPIDFGKLLQDAVALLRGDVRVAGFEPDELRDRLLAGYEHVLVDEYQDVDEAQYELIAAVAGRRGSAGERGEPATLLAVGDDDQNIYGWRGAQSEFLRRFEEDYDADVAHLLENFRSTAHIVAAATALIEPNPDRMKETKKLRVDRARRDEPRGGRLSRVDRVSGGCVEILTVRDRGAQTAAVFGEIERLRLALADVTYADFAVLARTHDAVDAVRGWCEANHVSCRRPIHPEAMPALRHVREIALALDRAEDMGHELVTAQDLRARLDVRPAAAGEDAWTSLVTRAVEEWQEETLGEPAPASAFVEHLHEFLSEQRRSHVVGDGVFVGTVHSAKGLEFPHVFVLDGGWETTERDERDPRSRELRAAEQRRTYFVAMSRARESLHLLRREDAANPFLAALAGAAGRSVRARPVVTTQAAGAGICPRRYVTLASADVDLGFAGRRSEQDALHDHVAALRTGQTVQLVPDGDRILLSDAKGRIVGALSAAARDRWRLWLGDVLEARVFAILRRDRSLTADEFRDCVRSETWEVPLLEIVTGGEGPRRPSRA